MANVGDLVGSVNTTEVGKEAAGALYPVFSPFVKVLEVIGIVVIVYIIFLIIKAIVQWRHSLRIKSIDKNVEEINNKLDVLIEKIDKLGGRSRPENREDNKEKKKK